MKRLPASPRFTTIGSFLCAAIFVLLLSHTAAAQDHSLNSAVTSFVTEHCRECHGPDTAEAGLNLEKLTTTLSDTAAVERWTRIYDRVASGEMPPRDAKPPADSDKNNFLTTLAGSLTQADGAHRQVVLRRLNRDEYENTVGALFGIDERVAQMLPEDGSAHGFDNIGEALSVSSELIQAYLATADVVLDATFGTAREPTRVEKKFPLSQDVKGQIGKMFRLKEDGVALFDSGSYCPSSFRTFIARQPGTYRVRIHARAFQSDKPVTMSVHGGDVIVGRRPKHPVGYYDLPTDRMTVVEFEDRIGAGDTFHPMPYGISTTRRKNAEWKGPGIIIGDIEVEGPIDPWPPLSRKLLLGDVDPDTADIDDARAILARILPRAFRRPTSEAELSFFVDLVTTPLDKGRPFIDSLRVGLKAILCSPSFLYLEENSLKENGEQPQIADVALASRLSYFLWSSSPDDELIRLAVAKKLSEPNVLRTQVERMLHDPRSRAFSENFTGQWLDLREIDFTEPDKTLYPEFDELLKLSMLKETHRFFDEVLDNDLSVTNFVDSDWLMLNSRLARHYGIDGVTGQEIRRVVRPAGSLRGGVLTQASVLKVTANGTNTSPVVRGVWALENIIGETVPPPPSGVPAVEPDIRGATTIREQLDKHRNDASCAVCHRKIDPPGFALESFDPTGAQRDWYRSLGEGERVNKFLNKNANVRVRYRKGRDVDASGETFDGKPFGNIRELKQLLLADKDQIARGLTRRILAYAIGRGLGFSDRKPVEEIVTQIRSKNYGLRSLIHQVVQSAPFRNR
jgi:hypothetical protein